MGSREEAFLERLHSCSLGLLALVGAWPGKRTGAHVRASDCIERQRAEERSSPKVSLGQDSPGQGHSQCRETC